MYNLKVDTGTAQYTVENLGPQGSDACIVINGEGPINLNDVGSNKLGPNTQTWGVCIAFKDRVWAYRYEGQGQLSIVYSGGSLQIDPGSGSIAELTS